MARGTDISTFSKIYRERKEGDFPEYLTIKLIKKNDLKYGENPHQHAAIYMLDSTSYSNNENVNENIKETLDNKNAGIMSKLTNLKYVRSDDKGKGGLSLTNNMDITRAMDVLKYFSDTPAVVIIKHNTVSGFAKQTYIDQTIGDLFRLARNADLESNFGGTVVFNKPLDKLTSEMLYELRGIEPFFVDVLAAPGYEEGVLGYLESQSATLRIGEFSNLEKIPKFVGDETYGLYSIIPMPTGLFGVQDVYLTRIKTTADFILDPMVKDKEGNFHLIENDPTQNELEDLLTAWWINISGARSNGIVIVKDGVTVAVGSGQVARVYAVKDAITKGYQKNLDLEKIPYDKINFGNSDISKLKLNPFDGAVCSSDAFFPNPDSIDLLARAGVTAVCHPFGSINDPLVIKSANMYKMAMPATLERCFGHF